MLHVCFIKIHAKLMKINNIILVLGTHIILSSFVIYFFLYVSFGKFLSTALHAQCLPHNVLNNKRINLGQ